MGGACLIHPGREAVLVLGGRKYCASCRTDQEKAGKSVHPHVEPKDCFVWFAGTKAGWTSIKGTGCAHYVAHIKNISNEFDLRRCLKGFTLKVRDLIVGRAEVPLNSVRIGDIYVEPDFDHCGIVHDVIPRTVTSPRIIIEHDSKGQGRVARDDFETKFHGKGRFYH